MTENDSKNDLLFHMFSFNSVGVGGFDDLCRYADGGFHCRRWKPGLAIETTLIH